MNKRMNTNWVYMMQVKNHNIMVEYKKLELTFFFNKRTSFDKSMQI